MLWLPMVTLLYYLEIQGYSLKVNENRWNVDDILLTFLFHKQLGANFIDLRNTNLYLGSY